MNASRAWVARITGADVGIVAIGRRSPHATAFRTGVIGRTGIGIIARESVVGVDAPGGWIARIIGADIGVVAVRRRTADTTTDRAGIVRGTGVAVVTRGRVVGIHTSGGRITGIIGADIGIIAIRWWTADTATVRAGVVGGTGVSVITGTGPAHVFANPVHAGVIRAIVPIVAIVRAHRTTKALIVRFVTSLPGTGVSGADAQAVAARIDERAKLTVVAGVGVVDLYTPRRGIACVIRTDISVIAVRLWTPETATAEAGIVGGAGIPVVAGRGVVGVDAPGEGIARIIGASIAVVTVGRRSPHATAFRTGVVGRTSISVVAREGVVDVDAPGGWIARIIGADIGVVAVRRRTADTTTDRAGIVRGTGVAVVTRGRVVGIHTSGGRITGIIGADIGIIAIRWWTADTATVRAGVVGGTGVSVITGTGPAHVFANPVHAGVIRAIVPIVAIVRAHRTTKALIVRFVTSLPGTGVSGADAQAVAARIDERAKLTVVAGVGVVDLYTPRRGIACVIRTDISVIAVRLWTPETATAEAGIVGGAGIPVVAGRGVVGVDAPGEGIARIIGASIAVVTVGRRSPHATAFRTGVVGRTSISVVAREGVVDVDAPGG